MSFLNRALHGRVVSCGLIFVILLTAIPVLAETTVPYEWPSIFSPRNFKADSAHLLTVFNKELIVYKLDDQGKNVEIKGLGRWDGQAWKPMGDMGRKLDVKALCPYDNQLFVGGSPLSESEVNPLAIWDGTGWVDFGNDVEGSIEAMVQWRDLLVLGGQFKVQGFPNARNLIAWDGESWQELPTSGLGGGYNVVRALAVHGDDLIVGGLFAEVDGVQAQNVARFDGDRWHGVGGGTCSAHLICPNFDQKIM